MPISERPRGRAVFHGALSRLGDNASGLMPEPRTRPPLHRTGPEIGSLRMSEMAAEDAWYRRGLRFRSAHKLEERTRATSRSHGA